MYRGKAHNLLLTSKYKYLTHYNFFPFKINIRWNPKIHNFSYSSQGQSHLYTCTLKYKFDVHVTVHRVKFLMIKQTRCTNFSNLFLE